MLLLGILKQWRNIPAAFVILLLGIYLGYHFNLGDYGISMVGSVTFNIPGLSVPQLTMDHWLQLGELSLGVLVILVAESWGSIRSLALLHGNSIEPNRELFALGAANVLSGLLQGMPVAAGFSASSANEDSGAKTKFAGVFAAFVLLLMIIFGQAWIGHIPEPVVAAAVINALSHALSPKPLIALWRMNRDQYIALAAVIAVLVFGVLHGMLIAIALSIASAIHAFTQPLVRELAELDDSGDFVDLQNHPNAHTCPGALILRPEEPLFFASVEGILAELQQRLITRDHIKILVISLEETSNLDSTAAESLIEFSDQLSRQQKILLLARVKDPISQLLIKLAPEKFEGKLFWSVNDAVKNATESLLRKTEN